MSEKLEKIKPFLKWAGNKFRIMGEIKTVLAQCNKSTRLVEPFLGSGAVFLNTDYKDYWLCDINSDLITLYQTLQVQGSEFIDYAKTFFKPSNNQAEAFYHLREQFNQTSDSVLKSALFLYLNRHGYNGLCRYNAKGLFNVPFGRYLKPYFPEAEMQLFFKKSERAVFEHTDFAAVMQNTQARDIVYCDPPYVALSVTAHFTAYSQGGFSLAQQEELATLANQLKQKGIPVLISNHDTIFIRDTYKQAVIKALSVQRNISCQARKPASEVLALFSEKSACY